MTQIVSEYVWLNSLLTSYFLAKPIKKEHQDPAAACWSVS